ncbi:uncharacterized protein [Battus philenor]|uniref:uncharacterized protein n=1 Tax=Battus philenor TaxID=42288 RepID=UPI0035CE9D92
MRKVITDCTKSICQLCECGNHEINSSETESDSSASYTDLYVIGKIWLIALKTALLGSHINLVPVVKAAQPPPPPSKPPPMKYTELPLYKSPHNEYNEYVESKSKCPDANVKLMRRFLLPYVTTCRKEVQEKSCQIVCAAKNTITSIRKSFNETKKNFTATMRDENNLNVRRGVVATGAGLGFLLGSGKSIPRRIFMTAAGAIAGGALCFPQETDDAFRDFSYHTGKTILGVFNWVCRKDFSWRERLACKDDLPATTGKIVGQCPPKK